MNQAAESELASIGARAVAVARSELEAAKEDMQLSELEEFLLRCKAKDFLKDFRKHGFNTLDELLDARLSLDELREVIRPMAPRKRVWHAMQEEVHLAPPAEDYMNELYSALNDMRQQQRDSPPSRRAPSPPQLALVGSGSRRQRTMSSSRRRGEFVQQEQSRSPSMMQIPSVESDWPKGGGNVHQKQKRTGSRNFSSSRSRRRDQKYGGDGDDDDDDDDRSSDYDFEEDYAYEPRHYTDSVIHRQRQQQHDNSEWMALDMPPAMQAPVLTGSSNRRASSDSRRRAISRIEARIESGDGGASGRASPPSSVSQMSDGGTRDKRSRRSPRTPRESTPVNKFDC